MNTDKARLLFVDDEERILRSLKALFRADYEVLTATDPQQALWRVGQRDVDVLVSDQRMPGMTGVELLRAARDAAPRTMRILLTGYSDLSSIVGSVNDGEIFRFINKPWDATEIRATVAQAADIARAEDAVLPEPAVPAADALGILVVDSDVVTREVVAASLADTHATGPGGQAVRIHWASTLEVALEVLGRERVALVVTELDVAGEDAVETIKLLKRHRPDILVVVLTSFADTGRLIELINEGQIYRFLPKPARKGMLSASLQSTLKRYHDQRARPQLLRRHAVADARPRGAVPERLLDQLRRILGGSTNLTRSGS